MVIQNTYKYLNCIYIYMYNKINNTRYLSTRVSVTDTL